VQLRGRRNPSTLSSRLPHGPKSLEGFQARLE
jgi:hypothetical protein